MNIQLNQDISQNSRSYSYDNSIDGSGKKEHLTDHYAPFKHDLKIAVIDDRTLLRECFARSLKMIQHDLDIYHFNNTEEFGSALADNNSQIDLALICIEWRKARAAEYLRQISTASTQFPNIEFVVVSDIDDLEDITAVIENGARGYISNNDHLTVALQAMYLVKAGGVYIPANVLMWSSQMVKEMSQNSKRHSNFDLTPRQLSVAEALRRGKANKLIAYELNMCESTVKVHIRSIMKKFKARNRTEAAFIINKMLDSENRAKLVSESN